MVKSLLSNELKWKRKEAVKAYFRYNSDMLKGNEKKKLNVCSVTIAKFRADFGPGYLSNKSRNTVHSTLNFGQSY